MRIEADRDVLLKGIGIADSAISSKNVSTILSNCLFRVSKSSMVISATDNEIGIRTRIDCDSEGDHTFTLNGKKLSGILKELPKGEVSLDVGDNFVVSITSKNVKGNYRLVGTAKGEYPEIPVFEYDSAIEIDQQLFRDMIRKVLYAAATDLVKPAFNGVYFVSEEAGRITAVATDSKRLSLSSIRIASDVKIDEGIIVPLKTIHEIIRLLSNYGTCLFYPGQTQCFFKIGDTEVVSRVVDGQFPNYRQVIPLEHRIIATASTSKIIESLRRVMIFTREPSYKVILNFKKNVLKIEARTQDLGEADEEMPISMEGDESIVVGMSAQYLLDSLKEIDTDDVAISLTSQVSPVVIIPAGDDSSKSVVMPIQIKSDQSE